MKKHILVVLLGLLLTGITQAADDPMKSLFLFQQKMASNGSTTAMMKLGEMYEQGQGTKQDLDKAMEMYQQAKQGGHAGADSAIERIKHTRRAETEADKRAKKKAAAAKRRAEEAKRRAVAQRKAEQARKARERAQQEALARKRAEEKARREAEARARAKAEQAARAKAAAQARRRAEQQARLEKARADARADAKAKASASANQAKPEQAASGDKDEGFKSDPCKGPAARVMSICK